jgi:hypothetical protein
MAAQRPHRQPVPELVLLAIGALLFAVARILDLDGLFIGSIFVCIFAGLAAVFSSKLAPRSLRAKVAATGIGLAATVFGTVWLMTHASSTEIFSPALILYPGGGLALSGLINTITHRAAQRQ